MCLINSLVCVCPEPANRPISSQSQRSPGLRIPCNTYHAIIQFLGNTLSTTGILEYSLERLWPDWTIAFQTKDFVRYIILSISLVPLQRRGLSSSGLQTTTISPRNYVVAKIATEGPCQIAFLIEIILWLIYDRVSPLFCQLRTQQP